MRDKIQQIREKALAEIDKADGLEKLNDVRAAILGKKGELTAVLKGMKDVAPDERPKVGQWVNETREAVEKLLDENESNISTRPFWEHTLRSFNSATQAPFTSPSSSFSPTAGTAHLSK